MKHSAHTLIPLVVAMLLTSSCGQQQISFTTSVKPILDAKCLNCHDGTGEGSSKTEFNVVDYKNMMQGTKYGPVINPGDSLSSSLYRLISHRTSTSIQMPPHHNTSAAEGRGEPLTPKQIETIKNWIDQGALNN